MSSVSVPCNLCGADDSRILFEKHDPRSDFLDAGTRMTTDVYGAYGTIVECRRCRLVYMNPRLDVALVTSAYQHMEDADYMDQQECRSINAHLCMQAIRRHQAKGRFLEIGCSTGFLLNAARFDFEPHGVELSTWAANFAKEKLKLDVINGTLDAAGFPDAHFDVIAMVDVIEHLTDPKGMLADIRRLLKPGGLLYLVTPDIDSLSARVMRGNWWGLRSAHLYYFSRKTMCRLLSESGFDVVEWKSYGRIFTYGYWLSRLRNYPSWIYLSVKAMINLFGVHDKIVYINTRDSMEVSALRKA